jgi:hypothetical protein
MYLYEDTLALWEEAVRNAPTEINAQKPLTGPIYNFMGLFSKALDCIPHCTFENLKTLFKVIEDYLVLDPDSIMKVRSFIPRVMAEIRRTALCQH